MDNKDNKDILTEKEAARYLGIRSSTLTNNRHSKIGINPPYCRLGKTIRYLKKDIDCYLLKNKID